MSTRIVIYYAVAATCDGCGAETEGPHSLTHGAAEMVGRVALQSRAWTLTRRGRVYCRRCSRRRRGQEGTTC